MKASHATAALFASCSLVGLGTQAAAQALASTQSTAQVEEVVVTGSRVIQNGNAAPTPMTVIGKDQLQLATPTTLSDALAQVPEFRGSTRPSTFVTPQAATGNFLNLRGLGANRVLTLFNGRRVVPTTIEGRIDTNTFPDLLVKRVDVVTGGASATYGSDAVAGVVNFVLDDEYKGVKGDVGAGVSTYGDNQTYKARLAGGWSFADDRLHVTTSVDFYKAKGVFTTKERAWDSEHWDIIVNPTFATDGRTAFLLRSGVTGSQFAVGGVITNGPPSLRNTQFLAGGVPAPFALGTDMSAATMVGGDGYWNPRGNVSTPLQNENAFAHAKYDLNENVSVFAEGSYSKTHSYFYGTSPSFSGTSAFTIFSGNAFLPAATQAIMTSTNTASFSLGRISPDWGRNEGVSDLQTYRGAVGFDAKLGKWFLDGAVDFGHTDGRLENNHSPNQTRLYEAIDAVRDSTGKIVCRSMLLAANANRGCVPLNPFGPAAASKEALNYVFGVGGYSNTDINQIATEVNFRGSPFTLPAGDLQIATGVAWRKMDGAQASDPLSNAVVEVVPNTRGVPASVVGKLGVFLTGSQSNQPKKEIKVGEVYAETQVPILRDLMFVQSLDVNASVRYADYSTTGAVTSWKYGGTWAVIDDIRFRATRSRDVRAPNISDLYSPPLASLGPIINPWTGANNNVPIYNGGNSNLSPEIAKSTTVGVILTPRFVPGFSLAVDYYKIVIGNSIGGLTGGAQTTVNLCFQGNTTYCPLVQRLADNTITGVFNYSLNQNSATNAGIDYEANYRTQLGPVSMNFRGLLSYLDTASTTDPFGRTTETAGVTGGENGGNTKYQGSLSGTFTYGSLTAFLQERFIHSGIYSSNYIVGGRDSQSIDVNHVAGVRYTDLTVRYRHQGDGRSWEAYGTVNNLFNQSPPRAPSRIGAPASIIGTNPTLFDVVGRMFNVGVRFSY